MEDERLFEERVSIRDSARARKKYGSTSNHTNRQEEFIKHSVTRGETLQGIALRYGVTMEVLRRVNRLFASDSLFLREFLLVPCNKDTPCYAESEIVSEPAPRAHRASIAGLPPHPSLSPSSPDEKKSFDDFLNRVDSSLADIKKHVEKTKESSVFARDLEENLTRHRPTARLRQSASVSGSSAMSSTDMSSLFSVNSVPYRELTSEDPASVDTAAGRRLRAPIHRQERPREDPFLL